MQATSGNSNIYRAIFNMAQTFAIYLHSENRSLYLWVFRQVMPLIIHDRDL